ncbi:MAG TPA: M23 family metallopeptidase [Allosphingosinicella sp.]|jgi:murein DD-endopeptidase MepM/ murein hydrolase activator NlpD
MMTTTVHTANAGLTERFRNLFKPREIFFHDGKSLRRLSVGSRIQVAITLAALVLLAWSAFATVRIVSAADAVEGDVAQMERQVAAMQADLVQIRRQAEQRARVLEQRQAFLTALLEGEEDADRLASMLPRADSPQQAGAAVAPYEQVDRTQRVFVERAEDTARERIVETAQQIRKLGLNPARFLGRGGPLEAVDTPAGADPRFRQLFVAWRQLDQLEAGIIAIPAGRPVSSASFTSGYGTRSDPFRGSAAMHAGVDLAGPLGTPIYATADGIVGRSSYEGAYGNLVEINHGQGLQTRYGHLSRLIARPGQRVRRGELIGLMGSTGRSTGSHLHYEVRIDGRAVNPIPFIQGGDSLAAVQRRADAATPAVALGGPSTTTR